MDISLLTLLIGLALGTFALGFVFARLAKLARLSTPAHQFAHEGATNGTPATPEPADVLTATQMHYQQTHINSLNTNLRLLEEKLRWADQDRQEADEVIADLERQIKAAKAPRGDEVTQREAELALLRAQLEAAISQTSKHERKAIRAEHDAVAAKEENQQLRAKLWAQQSTDVALSRLQDRQTALQAAINENQITRDRLAGEVVSLNMALAEREAKLAERESMLLFAERRLKEKDEAVARLVDEENTWEKQAVLLADTQAQAAQAAHERDEARSECVELRVALSDAGAQMQTISERLHALHEAMALRDGQVTELHGELRRLQHDHAEANEAIADLSETLALTKTAGESTAGELREALARTVAAAEETRTLLKLRDSAVAMFQEKLDLAEQQRETLEAALMLATANLESLRDQASDAEAGRMLLEVELENKVQALAIAQDDLAHLSSREYELTVALERTGREHQSSFETVLLHVNSVEETLALAQADLAQKNDALDKLTEQLHEVDIAMQMATQQTAEQASGFAALQAELQVKVDALAISESALLTAQAHAGELADEISALQRAQHSLETHLQAKTAVLATAEAVIASMRNQLAERDQQLADLRIVVHERGRELETGQAQIAYLTEGLDDLNNAANEKFAALQTAQAALNAAQTANEVAQSQIEQLIAEREALKDEIAGARHQFQALSSENGALHAELTMVLTNATLLQNELVEARAHIAQAQDVNAALSETVRAQAGEIIALANANDQLKGVLKMAEARADDLALALEAAGARQADLVAKLQFAQSRVEGQIHALQSAAAQQTSLEAQWMVEVERTAGERLALEMALQENTSRLEQASTSLNELRQAHAALSQEQEAFRRANDALELQTRNQMETLVELSDVSAKMQMQLQEREASLLAAQVALAQAQQSLAAKPEPGTLAAQLTDTTLTLQRLEHEFAALQTEKDAIEDEYTRAQIAGQVRMTEKEHELRECGAHVDALGLEIALLKAKNA